MNPHKHILWFTLVLGYIAATCTGLKKISNAQQLVDLFVAGTAVHEDIELKKDLDFQNTNLILPLGAKSDDSCLPYTGVFNGKGHKIKNLVMNNTEESGYAGAGLFCCLENAVVKDLVFDSSCSFTAESSGALSVMATKSLTVSKVTNKADIYGSEIVGGILGYVYDLSNEDTLFMENCVNEGNIHSSGMNNGGIIATIEHSAANMTIQNCINRGQITANDETGGIVGIIHDCTHATVTISNCINDNSVEGTEMVGGFIGFIYECLNTVVTIGRGINNGNVSTLQMLGGFIGAVYQNENVNISIFNSINNGMVTGSGENGEYGGIVGRLYKNTGVFVSLSNVYNNGAVEGTSTFVGGLVGNMVDNTDIDLSLINSTNNGNVTGRRYTSGLVGCISSKYTTSSSRLYVMNSANRGAISATEKTACGLFCVSLATNAEITGTVLNSINRGNVKAPTQVYGISNAIARANNVVSMGEVTESSESFTFWDRSVSAKLFYGLKGKCINCNTDTNMFEFNSDTEFYETVKDGSHVHELLNGEVARQDYGVEWSSELELIQSFSPSLGAIRTLSPLAICFAFVAFLSMMF